LSVNASPVELEQQDFVSSAKSVLQESGFEASLLEFEVTESVFMHRFGIVTKCLQELRDIGISVSIDDFGTGYSSLSYLQKLLVDTLKIDKSFVDQLDVANEAGVSGDESIVSTIVSLANTLGLKTVAEGIETERQASVLQQIGTDMGQGYFFSRPMDRKTIEKYLAVN
jgi:EAL domain-containing protein (putative c-di-GMP-specific phosphodiesterase class I)